MPYAKKLRTFALVAAALLLLGTVSASGAGKIGGNQIKKNAIASKHIKKNAVQSSDIKQGAVQSSEIKDGTVTSGDIKNGTVASGDIKDGTIGSQDLSQAAKDSLAPTFSGPLWSITDRNVVGNGDSYLRSGPLTPPSGIGSLGLRTGSDTDKAAFGNDIDFLGTPVPDLTQVGFSVFTTGENNAKGAANMPGIAFEIDPNLGATPSNFSTLVYVPDNPVVPGVWHEINAVTDTNPHWGLTGAAGVETGCDVNGVALCTFADVQAALNDGGEVAVIGTVMVQLGSFQPFSGAVDDLIINDQKFDFEPFGTFTTAP